MASYAFAFAPKHGKKPVIKSVLLSSPGCRAMPRRVSNALLNSDVLRHQAFRSLIAAPAPGDPTRFPFGVASAACGAGKDRRYSLGKACPLLELSVRCTMRS